MAALTAAQVSATIDKGTRLFKIDNGGKLAILDLKLVTAASVINPAGSIVLDSTDMRRLGFSKLLAVLDASGWTVGGVYVLTHATLDGKTNKIMLYDGAGSAMPATTIGDNGTLRLCLFGM
jgi:hypothetical protein